MAEVIVIGGGNAGLPAAIHAVDGGAHVTVVEKTGELGGALWFTSHSISGAGTQMQQRRGIIDSPQAHFDDIWRIGHGCATPEILRVATEGAGAAIDWLEAIGVPFTHESPWQQRGRMPGHAVYGAPRTYTPIPLDGIAGSGPGRQVLRALERQIDQRRDQLTIRYRTRAERLILGQDGRVTAVRVRREDRTEDLPADAVVLATGGFGANRTMLRACIPDFPDGAISICPPHAQGDGIRLAEEAGAALVNMDMFVVVASGIADRRAPELAIYWLMLPAARPPAIAGDIWVNRQGKRFIREDEVSPDAREVALMAQPGCELFAIFDEPMRRGLTEEVAATTRASFEGRTPNIIFSAPTIEDLADRLGLPPPALRATVDRYNAAVDAGHDPDFGRESMPKRIDSPPFHGLPSAGMIFLTHGGVKIAPDARVVRTDGSVFPNLFAAGEVMGAGQVMGRAFAGGQGVGMALTFGILAGTNAAAAAIAPHLADSKRSKNASSRAT
ncbi:MAG: flavocytochrome c [Dehalococcoidia bacterium]|nr:MAG: flavocytochrome c [Dehalococcoidia bacterium]